MFPYGTGLVKHPVYTYAIHEFLVNDVSIAPKKSFINTSISAKDVLENVFSSSKKWKNYKAGKQLGIFQTIRRINIDSVPDTKINNIHNIRNVECMIH